MTDLLKDLRYGVRMLLKRPGTSLLAIVALALGIGLTATMFSIVQGAFLRGLPFDESERLLAISRVNRARLGNFLPVSPHDFVDWRAGQHSFDDLAAFDGDSVVVSGGLAPERYRASRITPNTLRLLHVAPELGRDLNEDDGKAGAAPVALISHQIWVSQFRQDPNVLGKLVRINSVPTAIVGVLPPKFGFPQQQDLWRPLSITLAPKRGDGPGVQVFGRLKAGVSVRQATAEMAGLARQLEQRYPENKDFTTDVMPYVQRSIGTQVVSTLLAMLGAVFGVLLIACANVTNLQLARAAERTREVAIRSALGAGRGRIIRQMLLEGLMLSAIGALAGLGITVVGTGLFNRAIADTNPPFWIDIRIDTTVLVFVTAITMLSALISSLLPAWRATRVDVHSTLKDEGRANTGIHMGRFSRGLVIVEVLLSCCLLVVSGLMVKSVVSTATIRFPFATEDVFTGSVTASETKYKADADLLNLYDRMTERLTALPGVRGVALSTNVPTPGGGQPFSVEGKSYASDSAHPTARTLTVSASFFETLRVKVIKGRGFSAADGNAADRVVIVGEDLAAKAFPREDPLGRRIRFGSDPKRPWATVVGVVPVLPAAPAPGDVTEMAYFPIVQVPTRFFGLLIWTSGDPLLVTAPVRTAIREFDEDMALSNPNSVAGAFYQRTWAFRVFGSLFMSFGFAALLLASAGLYGVMAFGVRRRTQEIGVRMALGAHRGIVVRMIVWQGLWRVLLGIALGVLPAWFLAGQVQALLFNVSRTDPTVFGLTMSALLLSGLAASLIPALRAASVDPLRALRHD